MTSPVSSRARYWLSMVIVMTAACGGGSATDKAVPATGEAATANASEAKTDNACQLLTKAEAEGVLASPIKKVGDESKPEPIGTMLRGSCYYRGDDGGSVQLTVNTYEDAQTAAAKFGALKGMYRGARQVPNLGEDAAAEHEDLMILQGNRYLIVNLQPGGANKITSYDDTKAMDALLVVQRQIAARALGRLPATGATVASAPQPGTSGKSGCSFITQAEMENILGGPLAHVVPSDSPSQAECTYTGAGGRHAKVTVEWQGGESGMEATRLAGSLMGGNAGDVKATTPVQGIGDEAVMLAGGVLNVRKVPRSLPSTSECSRTARRRQRRSRRK